MRVWFTGTQQGMSPEQLAAFVAALPDDITEFHHGACKGADAQAALALRERHPELRIVAHHGMSQYGHTNLQSKPAMAVSTKVEATAQFRERNEVIVSSCDMMFAAPPTKPCPYRGGTRMTINIAAKAQRTLVCVYPDGSTELMSPRMSQK